MNDQAIVLMIRVLRAFNLLVNAQTARSACTFPFCTEVRGWKIPGQPWVPLLKTSLPAQPVKGQCAVPRFMFVLALAGSAVLPTPPAAIRSAPLRPCGRRTSEPALVLLQGDASQHWHIVVVF
jgi:hypothetical protein